MYLDSTASCDNELQDMNLAEKTFLSFGFEVYYSENSQGPPFN